MSSGKEPSTSDAIRTKPIADAQSELELRPAAPAPVSGWRRLASLPRAALGIGGAALISGVVAFYVPKILTVPDQPGPAVQTNVLADTQPGQAVLIARPPTDITARPGPGCDSFQAWGRSVGGVDARQTIFALVVQGNTAHAVFVAGLRAKVLASGPPRIGVVASCPTAGAQSPASVLLPLDKGSAGRFVTNGRAAPFGSGFTIPDHQTEVFDVTAVTRHSFVRWLLEVELVVDGRQEILTVSEHGRPFTTTAYTPRSPRYDWNLNNAWVRHGKV